MGETGPSPGKHPHLPPPVLIKLLIDLTRFERAMGLMTHTRAGLMARLTHRGLVWLETHLLQGRMKGYGWVSFSNKIGAPKPTFLNVQIFRLKIYFKPPSTLYCITRTSLSLTRLLQMPSKKNPLPLHVSRALIEAERVNVVLRTQRRIALLRTTQDPRDHHDDADPITIRTVDSHYCLNIFCFCVSLLTMNLLFLQWLYYKVHNYKEL